MIAFRLSPQNAAGGAENDCSPLSFSKACHHDEIKMLPKTKIVSLSMAFALVVTATQLHAHEYWLDPIVSTIKPGERLIVDIRNGEHFSGAAFPYDSERFQSVSVISPNGNNAYTGRLGDYPAIHPVLDTPGIHSIVVNTNPQNLTYDSWNKFKAFLDYHGFTDIAQEHKIRGLPQTAVSESYSRSAKTIARVAETTPTDNVAITPDKKSKPKPKEIHPALAATDSVFEIILQDNPYDTTNTISAQLLYKNMPLSGRQIEMFWKGTHSIRLTARTNEYGMATFKLLGAGDYMLNAVNVVVPENKDVHWHSYWASLTFER